MKKKQGAGLELSDQPEYVEWMKADVVESVSGLLKALLKGDRGAAVDNGASVLILTYLLCRNAGVDFQALENRAKLKVGNSLADMRDDAGLRDLFSYLNKREVKERK